MSVNWTNQSRPLIKFIAQDIVNLLGSRVPVTHRRAQFSAGADGTIAASKGGAFARAIVVSEGGAEMVSSYGGSGNLHTTTILLDIYNAQDEEMEEWQCMIAERYDRNPDLHEMNKPEDAPAVKGKNKVLVIQMSQIGLSESLTLIGASDPNRALMTFSMIYKLED